MTGGVGINYFLCAFQSLLFGSGLVWFWVWVCGFATPWVTLEKRGGITLL